MRESMSAVGALSRTPGSDQHSNKVDRRLEPPNVRKRSCVGCRLDWRHPQRGSPRLDGHYVAEIHLREQRRQNRRSHLHLLQSSP